MHKLRVSILRSLHRFLACEKKVNFLSSIKNFRECPTRCPVTQGTIKPVGKALLRLYNDLDIKCQYYDKCKKIVKLIDLEAHEKVCQLPKCLNFSICNNNAKNVRKYLLSDFQDGSKVCSDECLLLIKIQAANNDYGVIYKELTSYFKAHIGSTVAYVQPSLTDSTSLDKVSTVLSTGGKKNFLS